jgi:P-type Ca2+ transporter type 2C
LRGALVLSIALQILVVYAPFLQPAFGTVSLNLRDWLVCVAVASSVLWLRELSKLFVSER